jgi:hypothetical protein
LPAAQWMAQHPQATDELLPPRPGSSGPSSRGPPPKGVRADRSKSQDFPLADAEEGAGAASSLGMAHSASAAAIAQPHSQERVDDGGVVSPRRLAAAQLRAAASGPGLESDADKEASAEPSATSSNGVGTAAALPATWKVAASLHRSATQPTLTHTTEHSPGQPSSSGAVISHRPRSGVFAAHRDRRGALCNGGASGAAGGLPVDDWRCVG